MRKGIINYSQCWEDPRILAEALAVNSNDIVLSITSGGDNTLALLLFNPRNIVSIDLNPVQNHLLELKMSAARNLRYNEYLEFLGVVESGRRHALFEKVRMGISSVASAWWSNNRSLIAEGVINGGRFERFTIRFARYVLPLIHSQKTVRNLLSTRTIEEQQEFFQKTWNSKLWRFAFALVSSRFVLKRFARQRGMFAYAEGQTIADAYRDRFERNLASVPIADNFFLQYSLTGRYGGSLPPYLEENGYARLREMPASILAIKTDTLLSYLQSAPSNTFSKFNLSDIFEVLSQEQNDLLWEQIVRTSTNGAVVAYWNNLVKRTYPSRLSHQVYDDKKNANALHVKDRSFFYGSFHVNRILK